MPEIVFYCDDLHFEWKDEPLVRNWLETIVTLESRPIISLSYIFCSDKKLLEINKTYLNHDYFTDVITFDLSDGDEPEGEIYISLDRIKEHANTFEVSLEEELCRVMAHGLLHLLGYNDHTEEEKIVMRSKEAVCLSLLQNVPRGTLMG